MTDLPNNIRKSSLYLENKSEAFTGERLCIIRWKEGKNKDGSKRLATSPARCVSLPKITLTIQPTELADALTASFLTMQDEIIREKMEKQLSEKKEQPEIDISDLEPASVGAWYASRNNGHLTKEAAGSWFDTSLSDKLVLAFSAIMEIGDNEPADSVKLKNLSKALEQHRNIIVSLASPRTMLNENVAKQLLKAINLADDEEGSTVKSKLVAKLVPFTEPKEVTLAMGL